MKLERRIFRETTVDVSLRLGLHYLIHIWILTQLSRPAHTLQEFGGAALFFSSVLHLTKELICQLLA